MRYGLVLVTLLLFAACGEPNAGVDEKVNVIDTVISKRDVLGVYAGSAYLSSATEYALVIDGDTSLFRPIVNVSKSDSSSTLDMNIGYKTNDSLKRTHAFHMVQLKQLLPYMVNDHQNNRLQDIRLGTLTHMGDASVVLTKSFRKQYPDMKLESIDQPTYDTVRHFIESSSLAKEFNDLFAPYQIVISQAYLEKVFFITNKDFDISGTKLIDTTDVPEKLLFCFIGFGLRSTDNTN